jgi:hypothetical protein
MTLRRRFLMAALVAALALAVSATVASATINHSYTSTLSLTSPHYMGAARTYSGTQIHIQLTAHSPVNGDWHIALYRQDCNALFCWQTQVGGEGTCPYNGVCHLWWTGNWNGQYCFYFTKWQDGYNISSDNVQMWDWH